MKHVSQLVTMKLYKWNKNGVQNNYIAVYNIYKNGNKMSNGVYRNNEASICRKPLQRTFLQGTAIFCLNKIVYSIQQV